MNDKNRKQIKKCVENIHIIMYALESVADKERDSLNNLPDSLLNSRAAQEMEDSIDNIDDAISLLEESIQRLNI